MGHGGCRDPNSPIRHGLLCSEVTTSNLVRFLLGIGIALCGFLVGGRGIDWTIDYGIERWQRNVGFPVTFAGAIIAIGGVQIALGLGFFDIWLALFQGP